jgi:hypothetical protein
MAPFRVLLLLPAVCGAPLAERRQQVAVCLAGEARSAARYDVRERWLEWAIRPLRADLFLVLSPAHAPPIEDRKMEGWVGAAELQGFPPTTSAQMREIGEHMRPRDALLADDERLLQRTRASCEDAEADTCGPQLALAVRWTTCLRLIERAEKERGAPYTHVIRARPDFVFFEPLPEAAMSLAADEVVYFW